MVQDAIERVEPIPFLAVRFSVGAAVLWPIARRRPASPGEWRDGTARGLALLTGYVLQTIGLQYTDSATSAFLTYLLVVFVPVLGFVVHRRRPHPVTLAGIAVAVVGMVLLTDPGGSGATAGFGRGEVLTLGCAVAFAAHVVVLGTTARRHDPFRLTAIQVSFVGLACAGPGAVLGGYRFPAAALVRGGRDRGRGDRGRLRAPGHRPAIGAPGAGRPAPAPGAGLRGRARPEQGRRPPGLPAGRCRRDPRSPSSLSELVPACA